jgi:hypothetical protein
MTTAMRASENDTQAIFSSQAQIQLLQVKTLREKKAEPHSPRLGRDPIKYLTAWAHTLYEAGLRTVSDLFQLSRR